jgi:hypothetical protein
VEVQLRAFLTSALGGGEWSALPPGKELPVPIGWEAGWAPEPAWTRWGREKNPITELCAWFLFPQKKGENTVKILWLYGTMIVNEALRNIFKEAVVVYFNHYNNIFLKGLMNTTKNCSHD